METLDPTWLPANLLAAGDVTPRAQQQKRGKKKGRGKGTSTEAAEVEAKAESFERLRSCCSLCGAEPPPDKDWPLCAKCGETRYCGRECQVAAWKQPCAHKLSCGHRLPTRRAISKGTVVEVATILHEFGRADAGLAEACVARLAVLLAQSATHRKDGHAAGVAAATALVMGAHTASVALQRDACDALAQSAIGQADYKQAVVQAGGPEAIVGAMRAHPDCGAVQHKGCWALRNIALGVAAVQQAVVVSGGAVAAVAALRSEHAADLALATEACAALANMTGGDAGCQAAVLGAGAANAIVACMSREHAPTEVSSGASAPTAASLCALQAQGCAALGNLAGGDADAQGAVIDAGGAKAVVSALRAFRKAEGVQRGGRAALANMAYGQEALREAVIAAGAEQEWLE